MSYAIYDSDGFVGDLASNYGLEQLDEFLSSRSSNLEKFFEQGYSESIEELKSDLKGEASDNVAINETINNLRSLIKKCKDIVIIS